MKNPYTQIMQKTTISKVDKRKENGASLHM